MANFSRRSQYKVTYSPIQPSAEDELRGAVAKRQRGLEKVSFASALRTSSSEIEAVKVKINPDTQPETIAALDAISKANERVTARYRWREISAISPAALTAAGRVIAAHRRSQREELRQMAKKLAYDYAAYVRAQIEAKALTGKVLPVKADSIQDNPWKPEPGNDPRLNPASLQPNFAAALGWARVFQPQRADSLVTLARVVAGVHTDIQNLDGVKWDGFTDAVVETNEDTHDWTDDLVDGFEERMKVEPIGRLHLERIDMTPVGVNRGELVHSVALAPTETLTLIHREWSMREVSFEKVVTEEFEQSEEEGVTENTELAVATETQSRHSSALSMEASASGSWGFASASGSVGYNSSSEDENAKRDSRNHSIEVTRKAASRTRKEHKTTFTVKEQAGVEDESVRTLTNPSKTKPLRIDFHQMVRKWEVELYRYGLRLTYDLVVPAPGIDLLTNVDELRRIDHQLAKPFMFPLTPSMITRESWTELAARFGADVEPPDPATIQITGQFNYPQQDVSAAENPRFDTIEFDVPEGYSITFGKIQAFIALNPTGQFEVKEDMVGRIHHSGVNNEIEVHPHNGALQGLEGRRGHVVIVMYSDDLASGNVQITLEVTQTPEGWQQWQNLAWTAMRKGAEELWQLQRLELQQRRDRLQEEINRWDPLTLRRMEREEIMKTTLKWIFGPAFDLLPSEVARLYSGDYGGLATLEPSHLTVDQWAQTMGLGEFIKFLHQAIEWENVLFFVYPYFWDNPRNHALKRFLYHPDSLHQTFLRGGAARVVLTVRPGFEESFTRLFETGGLDQELGDHPYLTIAEEIRAYAEANYPGIPGASPDGEPDPEAVEAAENGKLIARWYEYTPISALDMTVNTPLEKLT